MHHSAHNVATSKVALIFTGRLKRSSYGSFCSPNALNSNFDYSTWLKRCLCWNSPESSRAKWSFKAEIIPLLSFCYETGKVTPFLFVFFTRYDQTKNIYSWGKNLDSRRCFVLDEWRKFPDLDPRMYEIMIKLAISLQFFQDPVIKGLVTEKI